MSIVPKEVNITMPTLSRRFDDIFRAIQSGLRRSSRGALSWYVCVRALETGP